MAELKIRKKLEKGFNKLVSGELEYITGFAVLRLGPGEDYEQKLEDQECVALLTAGKCRVMADGTELGSMGPRKNVFDDLPWAAYVPGGKSFRIVADEESELTLSYAEWRKTEKPVLVTPEDVVVNHRGKPGYERYVRDVAVKNVQADSLLVGETINAAGEWSSYPPHKHDTQIEGVETELEEVYFYKVNPFQGFGFQRVYTDDRSLDEAMTVEQNDLVLIPRGYHPVSAAPGYALYYNWALAGPKREMKPHNDPEHEWVLEK
ncbi:MAG: 5-deoxy-glucuronate isomerase [bacterium]